MGKIVLRLDRVMADRKISAIRFSTLEAICEALDCQPGDILEYQRDAAPDAPPALPEGN